MRKDLSFSLEDITLYDDDEDKDCSIARLEFLSSGENQNHLPIPEEVLKRDAHTVLGKFITGNYNPVKQDVEGHETQPLIFGYIPKDAEVSFVDRGDRICACTEGVLSKLYATPIVQMFKSDNHRAVSCEFTAEVGNEEVLTGDSPIESFDIHSVCVLGKDIPPACTDANIEVVKFSAENAEKFYHKQIKQRMEEFSERRKEQMAKTYKVNKTELKETPWGEIDKTELRNTVIDANNKSSLVHDVYAVVGKDWEKSPSESLGYPLMQKIGDTFYYNRYALSSALAYAKQNNEQEVISKVEALYKKFKIDDKEKGEKMEKKKLGDIQGREAWGEIIKKVQVHEGKDVYVDSVEDNAIIYTKNKIRYKVEADIKAGKDDKTIDADIKWGTVKKDADQDVKNAEYPEDDAHSTDKKDKEEAKDDTEKMSNDANVDTAALTEILDGETEEYKALAKRILEEENRGLVMQDVLKMAHERDELKQFKEEKLAEIKDAKCAELMANVKGDLSDEHYKELENECKNCGFEDIDMLSNKYLALAYTDSKLKSSACKEAEKDKEKFAYMSIFDKYSETTDNVDNIYEKYSENK